MRILNETDVPTKALETLIDFIQAMLPSSSVARFEFLDQLPEKSGTSGQASRDNGEGPPVAFPGLVEIWVAPQGRGSFPRLDQYVPDLMPILLRSWEEELVLVLAHELRHIEQFYTDLGTDMDSRAMEVDAETFAYEALRLWRARRPDRRCRTTKKAA